MKTRSLNIEIMMPWELGLVIIIFGIFLIILGYRQSKKGLYDDLDKLPLTKPTTKTLIGSVAILIGTIQLIPLINEN